MGIIHLDGMNKALSAKWFFKIKDPAYHAIWKS